MRRLALLFALIAMISAVIRTGNSPRMDAVAATVSRSGERVRNAVMRACLRLVGRFRPLLPPSN